MNPQTPKTGDFSQGPKLPLWLQKLLHHKYRFHIAASILVVTGGLIFLGLKMPWKSNSITGQSSNPGLAGIKKLIGFNDDNPADPNQSNNPDGSDGDNNNPDNNDGNSSNGDSSDNGNGDDSPGDGGSGGDDSSGDDSGGGDGGGSSGLRFPTLANVGVPAGWQPTQTHSGTYSVTTPGAVIEDMRINGTLRIRAANVTVRRVEVVGGQILNNYAGYCANGLVIEDSSVVAGHTDPGRPAITAGGYTARRVKILNTQEGFRVSGKSNGCGPVLIEDSYARVVKPADCTGVDWHGDALQGYQGNSLTIRDSVLEIIGDFDEGCGGTAAFFYPDQGNTSAVVDGLIVKGGSITFRMGMPGSVRDVYIVNNSWLYSPSSVSTCSQLSHWSAYIVTLNSAGQPNIISSVSCD